MRPAARGVERGWTRATNWTLRKAAAGVIWGGYQAYRVGRAGRWVGRMAVKAYRSTQPWTIRSIPYRIGFGLNCMVRYSHYRQGRGYGRAFSFLKGFITNKPCGTYLLPVPPQPASPRCPASSAS